MISFCNGFLKSMNKHTIFQHEEIQIHTNSVKCVGVSVIVPNLDGPVLKETFFLKCQVLQSQFKIKSENVCHNLGFWVLSQFKFLRLVTLWVCVFCHYLNFVFFLVFYFGHNLSFEFCHNLIFWVESQFQFLYSVIILKGYEGRNNADNFYCQTSLMILTE